MNLLLVKKGKKMILAIVNHKGGTGKTTTTINLGSALAATGHRVLLIDFDAQGSLSYSLGLADEPPTIASLLLGESSMQQVVKECEGMQILPADRTLADVEVAIAQSDERFFHLRDRLTTFPSFDFILLDCPPSLSLLTLNALAAAEHVIIPMQMDVLALRGLDSMLDTLRQTKTINARLKVLGVLPVMVEPRKNIYQEIMAHIRNNYNVRIFESAIRTSVKAAEAPSFGKSVLSYAPSSTTALDYKNLGSEILTLQAAWEEPIIHERTK
jgi:chromosome partitioning protein